MGDVSVADFVAHFLRARGVSHVFGVTGGASVHLIHSLDRTPGIEFVPVHHEQTAAMAGDALARVTGGLGAAIATSGPGATNLITGIASSWYDSVPLMCVTGQVATFRLRRGLPVRQSGFQETPIVEIVAPITKYAGQVLDAAQIRHELEKAAWIAQAGRPGPVLVDIPDDIQREKVDPTTLPSFDPGPSVEVASSCGSAARTALRMLAESQRPILIVGSAVRTAGCAKSVLEFAELHGLPICPTWGALDIVPSAHPLFVGTIGTHGGRAGNFAMQNSDLIVSIGARLGFKETGTPLNSWARGARVVVVDIDPGELMKFSHFERDIDLAVQCDAADFVNALLNQCQVGDGGTGRLAPWLGRIAEWKRRYVQAAPRPIADPRLQPQTVNPYALMRGLASVAPPEAVFAVDTGCTIAWMTQAFAFQAGQRLLHAFNNTPMGYAIPAAIGAAFADPLRPVYCLVGDGSLMMNVQDLATIVRQRLPIVILVLNNSGYAMVQQTQDEWLDSHYVATSVAGGLGFPDYGKLADAFGLGFERIATDGDIVGVLSRIKTVDKPALCEVVISSGERVTPQCKFGRPVEDAEPLLPRQEFLSNMIVGALPVSQVDRPPRLR
ncbi:MAG: thiamine pyrophosphate-binding protein [Candidatus Nanopelagicales bacterium]|nr:thiamine pyrophosphate-binding protein [Candidatus Nanopelagicales bacterium]